jgi:hypothetical protein
MMGHGQTRRQVGAGSLGLAAVLLALNRAAAQARPTRLVLIHGRGQSGLNAAELQATWLAALENGARTAGSRLPDGLDVVFPYYGDALEEFVRRFELPLTTDIQTRGAAPDNDFLRFQAAIAEEIRRGAGVTDEEIDAEYGDDPRTRGPLNWAWVQAILRAIDRYAGGISQAAIEVFTRDVYLYTQRFTVREAIDAIVVDTLDDTKACVVVAHSLGSVVAYNVLRNERRGLPVPLFVTLGSPLGLNAIRRQFAPLRHPAVVERWLNAFDPRDVVALNPLDAQNFRIDPLVENHAVVDNRTSNRHGIAGYLDDPLVANRLLGVMGA